MLAIAAAVHSSSSIPLLILGTAWTMIGVASWLQMRNVVTSVSINEGSVSFVGKRRCREVRVEDLAEYAVARGDFNRLGVARFVTVAGETIRVAARMDGSMEVLLCIKQQNDRFRVAA
ncbi:hypothetical protein [Nocardioides baekrokdamisoli]|nr:hypothetical protein [Nocardioides baekrokdamisoli]